VTSRVSRVVVGEFTVVVGEFAVVVEEFTIVVREFVEVVEELAGVVGADVVTSVTLQDFWSTTTPTKCSKRPKNGSHSNFATNFFWLNVVALVRVAIA